MRWLVLLSIAAVFGSISCENYNYGSRLQKGNYNQLYNKFPNFGSIRQPSGHWHYRNNDGDEPDNPEEETTDEDEESDSDLIDSNDPEFVNEDEQDNDDDLEVDEIDARQEDSLDVSTALPALRKQLESLSSSLADRGSQDKTDGQSSVNSSVSSFANSNGAIEENSSNQVESFDNDFPETQSEDITNLFGRILGSEILGNSLNKNLGESIGGGSYQNRGKTGDISSLIAGILGSSIPRSSVSSGLNKGISKIGSLRNNVLDFRDRALDQRVGTAQREELNQFDPRFQASLSNPTHRGSTGVDQSTWNNLRDLVTKFQTSSPAVRKNTQGTKKMKDGILGILGSAKGAASSNKGKEGNINSTGTKTNEVNSQSRKSGLLGLLGNAVSNKRDDNHDNKDNSSNRGGRFQFLTDTKNFVVNPVGFVGKKIKNKIKQKIKNELKQGVEDISNRVNNFKSNMTSLAVGGLAESFKTKPSVQKSKNCLNILTHPQAHHLYLNGKQIPQAWIFYVDKLQPLDFNSCPINHQDEVLKNCLLKGNVLLFSQPDKVKVEEEHGRQLEMIIAKDIVKDRLNGMVDTLFQNFGRQILKGVHAFRGDNNE